MTKPNSTLIVVVLDRSGSMGPQREATLEGLYSFVREQQKLPGECRLTLVQFADNYWLDIHEKPIAEVSDITYWPAGGTALLDAMGKAIVETGLSLSVRPEADRPSKVIFVTITDGEENASRMYSRGQVFGMISRQREVYKWEFLYLGANQDAIREARSLGIPGTHAMSWNSNTRAGTMSIYGTMSASVGSTRSGVSTGITNEQRKEYNTNSGTNVAEILPKP